ncbi:hypothetical protein [Siphonobacter sp. SORGH_AS_0500]|uniref:hypothetical protein n=1 Tax=Siphonobacter sp. SORGH_AS_0500 TaxID=1864824 RepID=UPI0012FF1C9E|nr:hypothetical protein [Siphonobacter sp. SORGH_AS_0500]
MKPSILFRLFNVFMVLVVLTTSTGFGLVEHTCHIRHKKKVSLVSFDEKKSCPACLHKQHPKSSHQSLKKQSCCQEETRYEHVSYTSSITKLAAKFVKMVVEFTAHVAYYLFQVLLNAFRSLLSSAYDAQAAIPLSGRSLLVFVQSFLI